ncbi:MAG: GFA family protein [Patescibacteria group bacterium]
MKTYTGGCHCGAVRYEVETDLEGVITCNCSHCHKKGFVLCAVDKDKFTLIQGADAQTLYQFGKKAIKHWFCSTCGTQSYAEGDAFPKMMINVRCLDDVAIDTLTISEYNGKDI